MSSPNQSTDKRHSELVDKLEAGGNAVVQKAEDLGAQGLTKLNAYVQRGPAGISVLGFFGGLFTAVVGCIGVARFDITCPISLLMYGYLCFFGIVAFLLEMDPEKMGMIPVIKNLTPHITNYQQAVFKYAKFLTGLRGRGVFYLFIGTLCVTECIVCLLFFAGVVNGFVGVMSLMMSYGLKPDLSPSALESAKNRTSMLLDRHRADYQPVNQF